MKMSMDVWNKRFGVFISNNECPIEGCSNIICKDRYCLARSSHDLPGTWEINDSNEAIKKPICCKCSSKRTIDIKKESI